MVAPLHYSPVPVPMPATAPAPAPPQQQQQQAGMMGREQCPRCASRDTKFCYYNNYNTAQPRHFCRACRRYWTLGGSLRNVPVGGSTRKRPRPARPTRAIAAAAATMTTDSCGPFAAPAPAPATGQSGGGLLSALLLGSAPLLEGRLGFDLGLAQPAGGLAQLAGFGAGPLLWPPPLLEGDRAEAPWKPSGGAFPPATTALWQELAAATPVVDGAGGLQQHHGAPQLLL